MLHATCDECGRKVNLPVNPNGSVEIVLEEPVIEVDEETGEEIFVGGEVIEVTVVDPSTGEPVDKHFCRECLVFRIASVAGPAKGDQGPNDSDDDGGDDDGDGDGDSQPVKPVGGEEEK